MDGFQRGRTEGYRLQSTLDTPKQGDGGTLSIGDCVTFVIRPEEPVATGLVTLEVQTTHLLEGSAVTKSVPNDKRAKYTLVWDGTSWWIVNPLYV